MGRLVLRCCDNSRAVQWAPNGQAGGLPTSSPKQPLGRAARLPQKLQWGRVAPPASKGNPLSITPTLSHPPTLAPRRLPSPGMGLVAPSLGAGRNGAWL